MSLRILTLNIWRMYEWDQRMPLVVDFIQKNHPDVIMFQEAQLDWRISPLNQVEQLNAKLNYPYSVFSPTNLRNSERGEVVDPPSQFGHGILSKYPITSLEQLLLTQLPGDKDRRTLLNFDIETKNGNQYLSSVHFSNSDAWAEAHFKETMAYLRKSGKSRILAGDFNIFNLSNYRNVYTHSYNSTADAFDYKSYPDRDGTLDYILIPKAYSFKSFVCANEPLSDHRALLAEIDCPL